MLLTLTAGVEKHPLNKAERKTISKLFFIKLQLEKIPYKLQLIAR